MITLNRLFKKPIIANYQVETNDVSGYSADVQFIPIDQDVIDNPYPSAPTRTFIGHVDVRSSLGVSKPTFLVVYHTTGAYAGYLTVQESTSTFAAGDVITVIGTMTSV